MARPIKKPHWRGWKVYYDAKFTREPWCAECSRATSGGKRPRPHFQTKQAAIFHVEAQLNTTTDPNEAVSDWKKDERDLAMEVVRMMRQPEFYGFDIRGHLNDLRSKRKSMFEGWTIKQMVDNFLASHLAAIEAEEKPKERRRRMGYHNQLRGTSLALIKHLGEDTICGQVDGPRLTKWRTTLGETRGGTPTYIAFR